MADAFMGPPNDPLLENLIKDIAETVLLSFDGPDLDSLDGVARFHVALAAFAVARSVAIDHLGHDSAQGWFMHMVADHWNEHPDV